MGHLGWLERVGSHRRYQPWFRHGRASERLFAEAMPIDLVASKRAGLHLIERAIQVRNRV